MRDRTLGYLVLFLLATAAIGIGIHVIVTLWFPPQQLVIRFEEIGNLRVEDVVMLRGVVVGKIRRCEWKSRQVFVTVDLRQKIPVYANYSIATIDKGLMGDRIVVLDPGTAANKQLKGSDTLSGVFYPGISEGIGLAWRLKKKIAEFKATSAAFLHGDSSGLSFRTQLFSALNAADSVTHSLTTLFQTLQSKTPEMLDTVAHLSRQTATMVDTLTQALPLAKKSTTRFIHQCDSILSELDLLIGQVSGPLLTLSSPTHALWGTQVQDLQRNLILLREGIAHLKKKGLPLQVRPVH